MLLLVSSLSQVSSSGRVVHISSSSGNSNKLGEALRATMKSDQLTREKLEELMHQFPKDVAEGKFAEKVREVTLVVCHVVLNSCDLSCVDLFLKQGWPRTAYGVSKMGVSALTTIQVLW